MELFYVIPLVLAILMVLYFLFQDLFPKKRVEHLPDRPARLPDRPARLPDRPARIHDFKHPVASKATSPKAGTPASDDSPMVYDLAGVSGTHNNGYNNSHGYDSGESTKHGYGSGGYDSGSGGYDSGSGGGCGDSGSGGDSGGGDSGGGGGCD